MKESKRAYQIGDGGLNLPKELFEKYGLNSGDEVMLIETERGLVVMPRVEAVMNILTEIGESLKAQGITLDDLIESGRDIRGDLLQERYGINPADYE